MKNAKRTRKSTGEIVSFKLDKAIVAIARRQSLERDIPFSMWLREAAREKLAAQKLRRDSAISREAVLA